jgi:gliding motility-associated-like protein
MLGIPTTDDNCTVASVTNDGSVTFPIGTTTVIWTVTDGSGNIETCEQLVVVTDIEFPTIVCPIAVAVNTDADECTASGVILGTPATEDNCAVASVTNNAPVIFPIGTTTVIWTVTDGSENFETCEQLVTVTDNQMPQITCPDDIVSCSNVIDLGTPVVADNCGIANISNDAPAVFPIGQTTTVTWAVTDVNGNNSYCEQLVSVSYLVIDVTASSQVSCSDYSDAEITVVVTGAQGDLTYSLNGGLAQLSNIFTGLPADTYTVEVVDENGCSITSEDVIVANPLAINASVSGDDMVTCFGTDDATLSVSATGGTGEYTYSVNGGVSQMSNVFTNMTAGEYSIMVTDENGCYQTVEVSIGSPEAVILTYSPYCDTGIVGIKLNATGGIKPFSYSIDGGSTYQESNSFEEFNNVSTLYLVSIDANNCLSSIIDVSVSSLNTLEVEANIINHNICYGMNDAVIEMDVSGGDAPYTFTVNDDQVYYDIIIDSLSAGEKVITMRDSEGCPAETEVTIIESEPIEVELISKTNTNCNGENDGTAEIEVVGGFAPYEYIWDGGSNQNPVTGLNSGNHTVTVSDFKGCEVTYDLIIDSGLIFDVPEIHNVFTPNNDGQNDCFTIKNIELFPENELVIVNRWGNEVYSRTSYNNLWDGSNLGEGTYFYVLKVRICEDVKTMHGYITIFR